MMDSNKTNLTCLPRTNSRSIQFTPYSSSYFTNVINKTALKSFNKWGGITFPDILSNYPQELIDNCWLVFSQAIIENYLKGKGTFIKNFGTFTFTNEECNLEGTTNQYIRDTKKRNPIFVVSKDFIDYMKPGIYSDKYGLKYYTQKENKNISIVKLNFARISLALNISKEEAYTIIYSLIKNMSDSIRRMEFKGKKIPTIGMFLVKNNIFGVKFEKDFINEIAEKSQLLYHIKKNFRFCMETKDSQGMRQRNINDIDKAERDIRPKISTITKVSNSAEHWLKNNMDIDIKKDIGDEDDYIRNKNQFYITAKDKLNINKEKTKNEFLVDQRFYRNYPIQNLYGLKISQDILESIYNNKSLLIRAMKQIDNHGDGIIPKFAFISTFHKQNCHHALRIELIEKIVNIYLNNDESIIMIKFENLINELCKDIKYIIDNEYKLFPINKYKYSITPSNKRAISQNMFSRDTGNLNPKAISSVRKYNKLPKISEGDIRQIIEKICKIGIQLRNKYKNNKMISYLELKDILGKYQIDINKELVVLLLKYMNIENPNCFYLKEFIDKVNNQMMNSTCLDFRKSYNTDKNNTLSNYRFKNNMKISYDNTYNSNSLNSDLNNKDHITNIKTKILQNSNNNLNEDTKINNEEFSHLLITKLIKDIKDRIFRKNSKIDNISLYFDKLLSYNICRSENVINLEELVRLFQLEQFKFTNQEIKAIFDFMDTKKDGVIDRIEFINAIRNIPHPLSNFINYMKNNGITIADIAYKIGYDIYNNPVNECLNSKLNKLSFQTKLKAINEHFDNEFIYGLFNYISEGKTEIKVKQFFDMINYNNDESYKNLFETKDEIINTCMDIIPKNVSYTELKDNIMKHDKQLKGEITSVDFISIMRKFLGQKIQQQNLFDFLRIYKLINNKNIINYQKFLMIIYKDCKDDLWMKSLAAFHHFLKKECNDDLFIFIVKINNLSNNISIKRTVESDRMQRFIRDRIGREVDLNTIMKFDFNGDGIISMDDLKNIVLKYIDKNYFETKEVREENLKQNEMKKNKAKNKELFLELKKILNKSNMTEDNLFFYLDKNQDNILDFDEFKTQLPLLLNKSINNQDLIIFFDYLDEYKIKQVDINTFRAKLRLFNDEIKNNHEDDYIGNSTIENLLLDEFSKWLKKNSNLCDTELFPILDHDHDGIITLKDIKFFANKILFMPLNELNDTKILHFIVALSITNSNYLVLADVQNIMKNIKQDKINTYENNIYNYCNEGISENNKDKKWITDVINHLGIFINEIYDNDLKKFYDTYNTTNFRNQGQGLSFDNFTNFLDKNYQILEQYHINKIQQKIIFNHISQNTKFITLHMLEKIFCDNKFNFYQKMHQEITKFLHENYPSSEDAFKYFHNVKTIKQETPTYNDNISSSTYITKNEFFNGINKMFPHKYRYETMEIYLNKLYKRNNNNNDELKIKFSEFNYIYYSDFKFDNYFTKTLKKDSKILTTREKPQIPFSSFSSPFEVKEHEKFETPYDLDPLLKAKKLILSSKMDFKKEFLDIIKESSNGMANQFEFRNIIKKLDIGLTNIEIEDIIHKSGMGSDGKINLVDFYYYIIDENRNIVISKKHVLEQLKDVKQLIYKYYSNPRLAFELNDINIKGTMDFDKFKKIIYDLYKREMKSLPPYSVLKYVYDYIDIRKDGLIDLNEWNQIFSRAEGKLDLPSDVVIPKQLNLLRKWETSNDIIEIYKMISKNRKIIRDKVKIFTIEPNTLLIKEADLIYVLKEVLAKIKLSQTQWKMIVSIGDLDKTKIIDFNSFINIIESSAKLGLKHPSID